MSATVPVSSTPSATSAPGLLQFPCEFSIKVVGVDADDFMGRVVAVVHRHDPGFAAQSLAHRPSRGGRYRALTCTVRAQSQAQLDALYQDLVALDGVKFVL